MARTILIIDDDRELCDLVGELLAGEGFDVRAHLDWQIGRFRS